MTRKQHTIEAPLAQWRIPVTEWLLLGPISGALLLATVGIVREQPLDWAGLVMCLVLVSVSLTRMFRGRTTLYDDALVVRNAFRTVAIPIEEIESLAWDPKGGCLAIHWGDGEMVDSTARPAFLTWRSEERFQGPIMRQRDAYRAEHEWVRPPGHLEAMDDHTRRFHQDGYVDGSPSLPVKRAYRKVARRVR